MSRTPSRSHRAEYLALRGAIGALGLLPWRVAGAFGARLGALGYRPFGIRREVAERQVGAAFPELDPAEVRRIARASFEHLGRLTIETALMHRLGRKGVLALVEEVEGWDLVEEALRGGRGALFLSGHFGNWEIGGAYIAARVGGMDAIVREMANPLFEEFLGRTRFRLGVTVVNHREAVRRVPRALAANRPIAFLIDQGVLTLASVHVPFFGRPAKTPRGPAVFALRANVPVLFGVAVRQPSGRYRLVMERVPVVRTGDRDRDVAALVASYTATLERWVRRAPEQYFWQHRRWKWQLPDTPPELRDPTA